jgi:hypothetical protein
VPVTELLPDEGLLEAEEPLLGVVLDEQAARATANAATPPTSVTFFLPRGCISGFSLKGYFV